VVDSAADYEMMALLDCFFSYHQIWLHKEGEEKESFITPFSTYWYLRVLEGLKNADPTFYIILKAILKGQIYRNVFTYVDHIVVSSKMKTTEIDDLAETFMNMRGAELKLNQEKCVFNIQRGKVP
jgi:hypothetical protein